MRISDWSSDVCSSDLERPGLIGRDAYTYAHIPIVAGFIVLAVANEQVLAHPTGHSATSLIISLLGGGLLFLSGTMTFKRLTGAKIGRESGRERVCQLRVELGGRRILKKKTQQKKK